MKEDILKEVDQHYNMWTQDNDKRMSRKGGWNDVTDAYYGKLPDDWPYITKIVDPRIRTSLIEKNARLINNKLRGRLVPREGGDILGAKINNALLDFQWDNANDGGSMLTKMSISDMDARLYQSKFGLVKWRCDYDKDGQIRFEGNEFIPLDIRDCGMDASAMHIKGAKWFQYRTWEHIEDLERQSDTGGKPLYKYLGTIKTWLKEQMTQNSGQRRKDSYVRRVPQLRGLEDRVGEDMAFPVIEIVHELREDRWVDYFPDLKLIIRDIPNPYNHSKIPIAQLRYYPLQDDPLGESEVEPVIPIWKAIQATVCGYMDEVILKMRPPLKVVQNAATIETIVYGPEAQWIVTRPDAITEMQSNGEAVRYFQTTYSALIAAFNTAMGDMSQGTSTVTPFESDKTATEVKASLKQQNVRDQKNQNDLGEFIKDIMLMWLSNNKQFLFSDPRKQEYVLRIVGTENFSYFKRAGLADTVLEPQVAKMIGDIVQESPEMSDSQLQNMVEAGKTPKHPVFENPNEEDPTKMVYKPKMEISDTNDSAKLYIVPEDLEGTYDYIPDVKSMSSGANQELMEARQKAIELLLTNQNVVQSLIQDGIKVNVKELIINTLEDLGLKDSQRYFEEVQNQGLPPTAGSLGPNMPQPGLPATPQANIGAGLPQQMAGPITNGLGGQASIPNIGTIPQGV